MTTLTRAQLAALTELHRVGAIRIDTSKLDARRGPRRGTLATLPLLGVVRYNVEMTAYTPALATWADGFGTWHVAVPDRITNAGAVARAVIAGEVLASAHPGALGWRPRVELDTVSAPRPGFLTYREV